ncbi:AAA family ATPase [Mycolicibacterium sp. 3033]|nr:AAA family ATPase [Mycolicibacterium aurantiacum]
MDRAAAPFAAEGHDEILRVQILGPLRVWRGRRELDVGPKQQACLLAVLLARTEHPVPTSRLIELIWDNSAPVSALNVIHKYVGALRRIFEPDLPARSSGSYLIRRGNGYLFTSGSAVVDIEEFHAQVSDARRAAAEGRLAAALGLYEQAVALWKGAAGADLDHGLSATDIFTSINAEFFDVCVTAADLALSLGSAQRIVAPLRAATSMAPLHEPVCAALISVLGACGQQAEALELFRAMRNRLDRELGVGPGQTLQRAHQRVLTQQPAVAAVLPSASSTTSSPPGASPPHEVGFVGREPERATAVAAIDAAVHGGTGLVLVEGEPGIGKTRFCEELAAEAARRPAVVAWGNCPPSDGTPAIWPWIQVVEAVVNRLPEQRQRDWRHGVIGRLLNDADTETLQHPPDGGARFHLFERVTALIAEAAADQPAVLIVDDLQWADPCSLDMFAHVAARLPAGAALIGTFRDRSPAPHGALTQVLAIASRLPQMRRIRLTPLSAHHVAELIMIDTRSDPGEQVVRSIFERTDGNPFFVRELTRMLVHREDGDGSPAPAVPASVRDIVTDRIAGVTADDNGRTLVITAALIGRTVDVNVLAHATGLDIHRCVERLEPLERLGILKATEDGAEVQFVHDLVREAVVELASSHQATRLHSRIADALESCCPPGEPVEERLAHHLQAAGPCAAPDRTTRALVSAAHRMTAKCAFETAEQTLRTAIRISRRAGLMEFEAEALARLIALVGMQSMYGSSGLMELMERAEHLAASLGREREATGLLYSRWASHAQAIQLDVSRPLAQRLFERGCTSTDPVIRAYGFQAWGIQQWNVGDIGEAFRHLQRSKDSLLEDLSGDHADPVQRDLQWLMAGMLAETTALHGHLASARQLLDVMKAAAGEQPYPLTVWATFACRIAVLSGDPRAAIEAARRGIAVDPGFNFAFLGTYQRLSLCWAEAITGDSPGQAAVTAEKLILANLLDPPRSCVATWYALLAEMWLGAGRYDAAADSLDCAERFMTTYGQRNSEGLLLLVRARLLRDSGSPVAQVEAAARKARAISIAREAHLFAQRAQNLLDDVGLKTCRPAV